MRQGLLGSDGIAVFPFVPSVQLIGQSDQYVRVLSEGVSADQLLSGLRDLSNVDILAWLAFGVAPCRENHDSPFSASYGT